MKAAEKKTESFSPFSEAELKELAEGGISRSFSKGDPIWNEGDEPDTLWILKSGRAHMVIESAEGNSSLVHFCTKAQAFCPAAAIAGRPYPCAAVAATDVEAVAVPRSKFMALFNRLPQIAKSLLHQMAPQICDSHCQQALSMSPVKDRLARLLQQLNDRYKGREIPFTRQELANMSGTTVETTIRTLTQWEREGLIQSQRGSLRVTQPEALEMAL